MPAAQASLGQGCTSQDMLGELYVSGVRRGQRQGLHYRYPGIQLSLSSHMVLAPIPNPFA